MAAPPVPDPIAELIARLVPPKRKRKRENDGEGDGNEATKRFNEFSFVINAPDGIDAPFPFTIRTVIPASTRRAAELDVIEHYMWQWERGGQNNRLHVQGVMRLKNRQYLTSITNKDPAKQSRTIFDFTNSPGATRGDHIGQKPYAHIDPIRSDYATACEYTEKDGVDNGRVPGTNLNEYGIMPIHTNAPGCRTDLAEAMACVATGADMDTVRMLHSNVMARYTPFMLAMRTSYLKEESLKCREVKVIIYWGKTGTGKTRRVYHEARTLYPHLGVRAVYAVESNKYFCGLDGHPILLFDEACATFFKSIGMTVSAWLKRTDRYPKRVEVKNGNTYMTPDIIYCTSNCDPSTWFPDATESQKPAILRRYTLIERMDDTWEPPGGWLDTLPQRREEQRREEAQAEREGARRAAAALGQAAAADLRLQLDGTYE